MKDKYYIGLDIGGTKCATTLAQIDGEPNILSKESFATEGRSPEETLSLFAKFIRKHEKKSLSGIGISCGGPLDSKRGVIMSPPSLADWKDIPVVDYFRNFTFPFICRTTPTPARLPNGSSARERGRRIWFSSRSERDSARDSFLTGSFTAVRTTTLARSGMFV